MAEPTAEEREGYLAGLRAGQPRPVAARSVNKEQTGTAFRRLMARDDDFAQAVAEAEAEGQQELRDLVRAAIQRRGLNVDDRSTKALEMMAATLLPEYSWLKRNGANGHGDDGDPLRAPLVRTELLTSAQLEQLVTLIEYGQGKRPNPELQAEIAERRALPAGDEHPVIDQ